MNNYLIIYNDVTGTLDKKDFHEKITKHLSVTDWWHYIPNGYIVTTPVPSAGITNSFSHWYPGLLFLIIKIDFDDASGVLPKEAFDWIGKKKNPYVKIKQTPLPKITTTTPLAARADLFLRSLGLPSPSAKIRTRPWTMDDFFKGIK